MSIEPLSKRSNGITNQDRPMAPAAKAVALPVGSKQTQSRNHVLLAILIVATMMAFLASQTSGQEAPAGPAPPAAAAVEEEEDFVVGKQYDSIPMIEQLENEDFVKKIQTVTKTFVGTGSGDVRMVRGYIQYYIPAKMTAPAPDNLRDMPEILKDLNGYVTRAARSSKPEVGKQITKFVFDAMKKIAGGNYHPAARINATLIISRLDSAPANNSARTPPVPYSPALPILVRLYQDKRNVDGVRAAALQGLHRYVNYGFRTLPPAQRAGLIKIMNDLLAAEPPKNRSAEAHAYMQRFAVDIIDVLRPNNDSSLGEKLISISTEPKSPDLIALYSASRIGGMGAALKDKVKDPQPVLKSWSKRAIDAFESELERFAAFERATPKGKQPGKPEDQLISASELAKKRATSMGGMGMDEMDMDMDGADMMGMDDMEMDMDMSDMMGMGMGMGMGMVVTAKPQPAEVLMSRRNLNHVLQQLHRGVTGSGKAGIPKRDPNGLLVSVSDAGRVAVESWVAEMEKVVEAINEETLDDETKWLEAVAAQIEVMRDFSGNPAPVDKSPAAAKAKKVDASLDDLMDELAAPGS